MLLVVGVVDVSVLVVVFFVVWLVLLVLIVVGVCVLFLWCCYVVMLVVLLMVVFVGVICWGALFFWGVICWVICWGDFLVFFGVVFCFGGFGLVLKNDVFHVICIDLCNFCSK